MSPSELAHFQNRTDKPLLRDEPWISDKSGQPIKPNKISTNQNQLKIKKKVNIIAIICYESGPCQLCLKILKIIILIGLVQELHKLP